LTGSVIKNWDSEIDYIPRLQAQLHNTFLDYYLKALAPASTVKTIYGVAYEKCIPKKLKRKNDSKKRILEYKNYLIGTPIRVACTNGDRLKRYLHEIYYRNVSSASQLLIIKKMDFDTVMKLNKTQTIKHLKSKGYAKIAKEYELMLKNTYKYSISSDMATAHKAIISGYNALKMCIEIAEK
jgi:hypothetical protein